MTQADNLRRYQQHQKIMAQSGLQNQGGGIDPNVLAMALYQQKPQELTPPDERDEWRNTYTPQQKRIIDQMRLLRLYLQGTEGGPSTI